MEYGKRHTFDDLPTPILETVLSSVNPDDLGRLACVCKRWKQATVQETVCAAVYISFFGMPDLFHTPNTWKIRLSFCFQEFRKFKPVLSRVRWACEYGHYNLLQRLAVDFPTIIQEWTNTRDSQGNTALHIAAAKGHIKVVDMLCKWSPGAIDNLAKFGRTALHSAAYVGSNVAMIGCLLRNNANIDLREGIYGQSALHVACARGHTHVAEFLLLKGYPVNVADIDRMQPIHLAALHNRGKVTELLLQNKADPMAIAIRAQTALQIAQVQNSEDVLEIFEKYFAQKRARTA